MMTNAKRTLDLLSMLWLTLMMMHGAGCSDALDDFPPNGAIGDYNAPAIEVPPGEIVISMGAYSSETGYTPFEVVSDGMEVAEGVQGGVWVMPALRAIGCENKVLVTATITTETGEVVGQADTRVKLFPADDGWLEIQYLPIRIQRDFAHADEDVFDILGMQATVSMNLSDDEGNMGSLTFEVTLIDGIFFGAR